MNKDLIKELELLRFYKEKGCLDTHYKVLIDYIDELEQENKELHNKIDKAIEALDGIRKIIETEKRLMGYAIYDSCLLLIEEQLDKAKDLKDSDIDDNR